MTKIKEWVINILIKAKIGEWIAKLFSKIKGGKTEIGIFLVLAIKFCIYSGIIPAEFIGIAEEIIKAIYGVITVSFGDKIRRFWEASEKSINETIEGK